jgi:hypothetical protein
MKSAYNERYRGFTLRKFEGTSYQI